MVRVESLEYLIIAIALVTIDATAFICFRSLALLDNVLTRSHDKSLILKVEILLLAILVGQL